MKTKIKILIGVLMIFVLTITGCKTVVDQSGSSAQQLDPQRTAGVIRAIVPPAVRLAVAKYPDTTKWFLDAKVVICALSTSTNVSPSDLKTAIKSIGVREIQTPEINATIEAVYGIYSAYYADVVRQKLPAQQWCSPVLSALCESLGQGLE